MGVKMAKKMCKLVKEEFHTKKLKQFVKMLNKPKYICKKCGRVANAKCSLCKPLELP
jgi:hypothetical protein